MPNILTSFGGLSNVLAIDDYVLPFLDAWPTARRLHQPLLAVL